MADNIYTGPGWYWVNGIDYPVQVRKNEKEGVLEAYDDGWIFFNDDFGFIDPITRIEKPETRPTMDWSVLPAWAKWIGLGDDGRWFWSSNEPHKSGYATGVIPDEYAPKWKGDNCKSLVNVPR